MPSVRQMGSIVHPPSARKRVTVALKAYFDESGTHWGGPNAAKVFVLCGYIATEDVWDKQFEGKWHDMLQKPEITPKLSFFHAEDVEGRGSKRFRKITQRERDHLKTSAFNIVVNSGMLGVGVAVELEPFSRLVVADPKVCRAIPGNPYMFAFNCVVIETLMLADAFIGESKEKIAFIFENHPQWSIYAHQMYNDFKVSKKWPKEKRDRLGTPAFEDKKEFKPLQAADHLAYETYRYMKNRNAPLRPAMTRFLSWQQHHGRYFDERLLREFIEIQRKDGHIR
jgi:hypothetical protein